MISRRAFVRGTLSAGLLSLGGCMVRPRAARVVVIGGGFGGASAARALKRLDPSLEVTLIEPKETYVACPFSNLVLSGDRELSAQTFSYQALTREGILLLPKRALGIDPVSRIVDLDGATQVGYDRLILAPGISLNYEALPGYSAAVSEQLPHAWQAGAQTEILRSQLEAMRNGGLVALSIPENPYRCPPGPYERASLIARYLKKHKPRSKILLLDAKDRFSKQNLFKAAWQSQFPGMIEWQGRADGAIVVEVEAEPRTLKTDFDTVRPDVANVIPPQRAGDIALTSGLADSTGWCPVDALSFESRLANNIHVIGDAAILNAMPKSAFSANAQAKLCAVQVVRLLKDLAPLDATLANTCYSLINPDYGISVAGVYQAEGSRWVSQPGAGGVSPNNVSYDFRRKEALYAKDWFNNITRQTFL